MSSARKNTKGASPLAGPKPGSSPQRRGGFHAIWLWAGIASAAGAIATVAFRESIHGTQWLLTGHTGGLVETAMGLPWWERVLVPIVGGLCAGVFLHFGTRLGRGQSSTDYMEAIAVGNGVISTHLSLIKSASSLYTVASGGSIGREGAMVQLAAMLASLMGRLLRLPPPELRLLVACGAAAGIASAYNAPIAATMFVSEIVLGSIAIESIGPLIVASVIANTTVHQFLGYQPIFQIPAFRLVSNWELLLYAALGLVAGHLAPTFLTVLEKSEALFSRLSIPVYMKLPLGGLMVGSISVIHPEVWGNGYSVVNSILHHEWLWHALLAVLLFKMLATAATVGSGAVGGVFTPTLFVGAVLGALLGQVWHAIWPTVTSAASAYAVVGMGAFLAATTHAPLMSILMVFEMTLDYQIVLPLMLACVIAHYTAKVYRLGESIYADSLRRKRAEQRAQAAPETLAVALQQRPLTVWKQKTQAEVLQLLTEHPVDRLYVTDAQNQFLGVISLRGLQPCQYDEQLVEALFAVYATKRDFPVLTTVSTLDSRPEQSAQGHIEDRPLIGDKCNRTPFGSTSETELVLMLHGTSGASSSHAGGKTQASNNPVQPDPSNEG